MKDLLQTARPFNLMHENFAEGFWHADNAPVFFKTKKQLVRAGTVSSLKPNETFFVELWGGDYAGRYFFMKAIRRREKEGLVDCIWLSKKGQFFRNICGRALFSDIPEGTAIYKAIKKEKKRPRDEGEEDALPTPKKLPKEYAAKAFPDPKALPRIKHVSDSEAKEDSTVAL